MTTPPPCQTCDEVIIIREQLSHLKEWQLVAESDLRRFRDLAAKIDLLVWLSGGGGLVSLVTLAALVFKIAQP